MTTKEFVKKICQGSWCPNFNWDFGCRAYDGDECDEAFCHPYWHGKSMIARVNEYCEKRRNIKDMPQKEDMRI